jgi:tripartite-type tricarboxylate transporter receptor subunit TctC
MHMFRIGKLWAAAFTVGALGLATAHANETQPSRPVKIIVQTAAGSSIDVAARIVADALSRKWGQQAYVLNQPGAGGAIAAKALAGAAPDGETLLFAASSIFIALPELQKAQAAAIASFVPISFVGEQPMAVAVTANLDAKSFAELLQAIKRTPGGFNVAVSTRGGLSHLSGEALREAAGVEMKFINYPGTAQALSDVTAGRVPVLVDSLSAFVGPAAGGQVRILAVGSAERLKTMPDLPAVSETLPGFDATAWLVLVAPPGTPAPLAAKIAADVGAVLSDPAVTTRLEELGTFVKRKTPAELTAFIEAQRRKWAPVVQKFGTP